MPSIFTKIINNEIPCFKIAEDADFIAFLDVFPLVKGHILVVPKQEIDYIFDMPAPAYTELMAFAQKIAVAQKKAIACKRIAVAVIGLEVPHAHVHLIPINVVDECNFSNPKKQFSTQEMQEVAEAIKHFLV